MQSCRSCRSCFRTTFQAREAYGKQRKGRCWFSRVVIVDSNIPGNIKNSTDVKLTSWDDQPPCPRTAVLVQTQRGVPSVRRNTVEKPCPSCSGTGKTVCGNCRGKGRVNYRNLPMLPQGVWPEWCPCCRASGRWHCERCMGTGVKRDPIGFRLGGESD